MKLSCRFNLSGVFTLFSFFKILSFNNLNCYFICFIKKSKAYYEQNITHFVELISVIAIPKEPVQNHH